MNHQSPEQEDNAANIGPYPEALPDPGYWKMVDEIADLIKKEEGYPRLTAQFIIGRFIKPSPSPVAGRTYTEEEMRSAYLGGAKDMSDKEKDIDFKKWINDYLNPKP